MGSQDIKNILKRLDKLESVVGQSLEEHNKNKKILAAHNHMMLRYFSTVVKRQEEEQGFAMNFIPRRSQ